MPHTQNNSVYVAGLDIGSMAAKAVIYDVKSNTLIASAVCPTGWNPQEAAKNALLQACENSKLSLKLEDISYKIATGYGRISLPPELVNKVKTEISCHAKAVATLYPEAGLVLDIGGQDSKVINIDSDGLVSDFLMNDKCAAGTGRFLQVVSGILNLSLDDLGLAASKGKVLNISNMCAVFAESEIIGLLAKGAKPEDIAAGVFVSIARRMRSLAGRMSFKGQCVFTGGLATNPHFVKHLAEELQLDIRVPENPQCMGALGAALFAKQEYCKLL